MDISIKRNRGQAAGKIENHYHSLPCPGPDSCMFSKSEAEQQRRFEKHTGIVCPRGAREVLEHLLNTGVFDFRQIEFVWRKKNIWWDLETTKLMASINRFEMWYGLSLMWGGAIFFITIMVGLMFLRGHQPLTSENVTLLASGAMCLASVPFAEKHLVRPNRVARRIKPYLDEYYNKMRQ